MFVDKVKVHLKAGEGGNGCVSFRREKYVDRGGPDGGDGGKGGDVILVADKNCQDLTDYFYAPRIAAKHGEHGRGKGCTGRNATDVIIKVPIGTQVHQIGPMTRSPRPTRYHPAAATEEFDADADVGREQRVTLMQSEPDVPPDHRQLVADMVEDGQQIIICHGGKGGRGNAAFKSSRNQTPRDFEYGQPGEEGDFELELKTLADIGLVGHPNAGKSTLISKLTPAHPKIAAYPFTTLTPNVGVIVYDDFVRIRLADIPGLIEGAHAGKGLGHDFLRHIERCRLLVIILDMAGTDDRKPWDDYKQLLKELKLYKAEILEKPRVVVANKMDAPAAKKNLAAFKRKHRVKTHEISALEGTGLDKLKLALRGALE
jgi:GTP-binding protein